MTYSNVRPTLLRSVAGSFALAALSLILAFTAVYPAYAQGIDEIVVTARKRTESLMETPVVIQAYPAVKLERLKIVDLVGFSSIVPGLVINRANSSVGGTAFLRGIGNGDAASWVDQSVLLNIDGASMTHGSFMKAGLFDLEQIDVLKGPQALFFGKSASAGIIAIRTADPGDSWETKVSVGYEFDADEIITEAVVSGPLNDNFGLRIAGFFSDMKGYQTNPNTVLADSPIGQISSDPRVPDERTWGGRATLKFDSGDGLRFRAKLTQSDMDGNAFNGDINQMRCTLGTAQKVVHALDDCKLNETQRGGVDHVPFRPDLDFSVPFDLTPFAIGSPSNLARGTSYNDMETTLATLDIDWDIAPDITLTSVSSFAKLNAHEGGRAGIACTSGCYADVLANFKKRDISQELRLASDFDSPFNFLVGGLYGTSKSFDQIYIGLPGIGLFTENFLRFKSSTLSAFAQLLIEPIPEIEISLGARYTTSKIRPTSLFNTDNFPGFLGDPFPDDIEQIDFLPDADRRHKEDNVSPEVTVSYTPTDNVLIYGSYKQGYKGPGYNAATTGSNFAPPNQTSPIDGEDVEGGEIGLKATLLDDRLNVTAAVYRFKYDGLQVSSVENATFQFTTRNGAVAIVKGVELGLEYSVPGIEGLTLNSFVNYNSAKYKTYDEATCFGGQTAAGGCVPGIDFDFIQDLAGRTMHRAPRWAGVAGFDYQATIANSFQAGLFFNANYSSSFNSTPELNPTGEEKGYILFDATLSLSQQDGPWELSLITRNLANKFVGLVGIDDGQITPGVPADVLVYTNRPRQIMLRLTLRPSLL